ncbi:hypothetical protein EGW08_000647 [Elysia chlorotica]|uniref:Uncharacterized protein n=1 Tax=Elysia chlorotica TaxID=188477 RepID=A0A433UCQ6_ELYCH|nr:hypothetical protein EGW08_000647 [Elysia chlorotica]
MDTLSDRNNVEAKNDFSVFLLVKQHEHGQMEKLDIYPESDSIHNPPLLQDRNPTSNKGGERESVLGLQSLQAQAGKENSEDSIKALNAEEDGQLVAYASANQNLRSSCEATSSQSITNTPCSISAHDNGDVDSAESANVVGDTMRKTLPLQASKGLRRPGVILLGRGNSFSFGRSEVIFLHNTKPYRRSKAQTIHQQGTGGTLNSGDSCVDNNASPNVTTYGSAMNADAPSTVLSSKHASTTSTSRTTEPGRPPPPLSNQVRVHSEESSTDAANYTSRPILFTIGKSLEADSLDRLPGACHPIFASSSENSTDFKGQGDGGDDDEVAALWANAELIMAGKQKAVLDVLAQFGVGQSGEDTKGNEEEEEESVWQVVENKTHADVR